MSDLQDIALVNIESGAISSIAGFSLHPDASVPQIERLSKLVKNHLCVIGVPADQFVKGDLIPNFSTTSIAVTTRHKRRPTLREQRSANSQCVRCGSPNLFTTQHCEACSAFANKLV